jgi:hypothetical protein
MTEDEKKEFINKQLERLQGVGDDNATLLLAIMRLHADVEEIRRHLAEVEAHRRLWGR